MSRDYARPRVARAQTDGIRYKGWLKNTFYPRGVIFDLLARSGPRPSPTTAWTQRIVGDGQFVHASAVASCGPRRRHGGRAASIRRRGRIPALRLPRGAAAPRQPRSRPGRARRPSPDHSLARPRPVALNSENRTTTNLTSPRARRSSVPARAVPNVDVIHTFTGAERGASFSRQSQTAPWRTGRPPAEWRPWPTWKKRSGSLRHSAPAAARQDLVDDEGRVAPRQPVQVDLDALAVRKGRV